MKRGNGKLTNNVLRGKAPLKQANKAVIPKKITMTGAYQNLASLINEYENIEAPLSGFSSQQIYQKVYESIGKQDLDLLNSYITFHKETVTEAFHKTVPKSLLHFASKLRNANIVLAILRLSIPTNILNKSLKTPMHKSWRNIEVVKILLNSGAEPNPRDKDGKIPLHFAIRLLKKEEIVELIKLGFDLHARDNNGVMPVDLIHDSELVRILENNYFWQKSKGILFVSKCNSASFIGSLSENLLREVANFL